MCVCVCGMNEGGMNNVQPNVNSAVHVAQGWRGFSYVPNGKKKNK